MLAGAVLCPPNFFLCLFASITYDTGILIEWMLFRIFLFIVGLGFILVRAHGFVRLSA
jgi:hypothetical protein